MKKRTLSNRELKELNEKVLFYDFQFDKGDIVNIIDEKFIMLEGKALLFYYGGRICPTLHLLLAHPTTIQKITVDMGAVKFVSNGADVMRPGITHIEDNIQQNDIIAVIEEKFRKPLAIGVALFSSSEMSEAKTGKVVKNLHYVEDAIWEGNF